MTRQRNVMPSLVTSFIFIIVAISTFSSIPSASSFQDTVAISPLSSLSSVSSSIKFLQWSTHNQSWCSRTPLLRSQWLLSVHPPTQDDISHTFPSSKPRRALIFSALSLTTAPPLLPSTAHAALPSFLNPTPPRQLSYCIVTLLRVRYWALFTGRALDEALSNPPPDDSTAAVSLYLEARLGSKTLLTHRIGGGSNTNVLRLSAFELRECLRDGISYLRDSSSKREGDRLSTDVVESLAAIVEFDGLETTTDPSPRSSLTKGAYKREKGVFVKRLLLERVVPDLQGFLRLFEEEEVRRGEEFMRLNYPGEVVEKLI